jgi:DNA replication and repair protein RecF
VRELFLETLSIRCFRNLDGVELKLNPGFIVVSGENGQGKTNLLEAVYSLATSKSFRVSRPGALVRHGEAMASVRGAVLEGGERRTQSVGLKEGGRYVRINGARPHTLAAYAIITPAVVVHPGDVVLTMGGGAERRRLLDRTGLYLTPTSALELERYTRALRERQKALETRGPSARDVPEWEELMVRHGVAVHAARSVSARQLGDRAREAFSLLGTHDALLDVRYAPGSPDEPETFRRALERSRAQDARRGAPAVGPHKDDLSLVLNGQPVRGVASQGQHRSVVLALKSAELVVIALSRGVRPILLLDDVSSELDRGSTSALFRYLQGQNGQVFLTTTRPELIDLTGSPGAPRQNFRVQNGVVRESACSPPF